VTVERLEGQTMGERVLRDARRELLYRPAQEQRRGRHRGVDRRARRDREMARAGTAQQAEAGAAHRGVGVPHEDRGLGGAQRARVDVGDEVAEEREEGRA
jgi:hypothetical protein